MIKFFRKIRQKLLSEGNTGKYLKYAVGETVLVVIGILIALSINNWNEQRKKNNQEQQLLDALKTEIKENIQDLKIVNVEHVLANDAANILFGLYSSNAENVSTDSIQNLIRQTEKNYTYDPSLGNLKSIISSGQLGYISNSELKSLLASLEDKIIDTFESINWISDIKHDLGYRTKADFMEVDFSDGVKINKEKWLASKTFYNWLFNHSIHRNEGLAEEKKLLEIMDDLLKLIEMELIE
jgi:hypothetical protein